MDAERSWRSIEAQRRAVAELLANLSAEEWDHPSLCSGWRVRDVAAHIILGAHAPGTRTMITAAVRAHGSFHRLNHDIAVTYASRPTGVLASELRAYAGSRKLPTITNHQNALFDILVHSQDIALPLNRRVPMPLEAAAAGASRVWTMGWPFRARKKFRGFHLQATDIDWSAGDGLAVNGPIEALLLLLTGRPIALERLTGDGAERLRGHVAQGDSRD